MIFVGIDNGVSGSIGIVPGTGEGSLVPLYFKMPIEKQLNYTKTKAWINRINVSGFYQILSTFQSSVVTIAMERPMVNPGRFKATVSALRALEATLITVERLGMSYRYIDSKEWQKALLPAGLEGPELKEASLQVGMRLFPKVDFGNFKDADGLLIAEYLRRTYEKG
jgi:hypothetical protein